MATLLGYTIANDRDTVTRRQESPLGYIKEDEPALIEFGILIKSKDNAIVRNSKLGISSDEIRDFLNWVVGKRNPPLPNLVRKILCLKRARIANSIESVGTSPALRTKETQMIAEIDTILRDDGVTNPENKTKCITQSAGKYDSNAGAKEAMANAKSPASETITTTTGESGTPGGPCTTIVNCDSSVILNEMKKIQESLVSLHSVLPKSAQANTINGMVQDIQMFKEQAKDNQEASPIVKMTNDARSALEKGENKELIKLLDEIPDEIKKSNISPIAAEAAAANLKMIKDKQEDLPEKTKNSINDMINKLNKQASPITEPIVAFRVQLDNLADVVKNQPAKIEEEVNDLLPKLKDQYVAVANKFEEEMKDELEKIGKQIDDSTADIRTNIASIKPVDYEPQFKHLDDSVRTMYDTLQKLIAEDYSRRFDELNKKIDDLTGLMAKCCNAVEYNAKPTLNINNSGNNQGTITKIEPVAEAPVTEAPVAEAPAPEEVIPEAVIEEEQIEEIPTKTIKKVALPNANNYLIKPKLTKIEASDRRILTEPNKPKRIKQEVPEYIDEKEEKEDKEKEEEKKPFVVPVRYANNNFAIQPKEQLKEELSARRLFGEPEKVKRVKQQVPEYDEEEPQTKDKVSTLPVSFANNNFSIPTKKYSNSEQSSRRIFGEPQKISEKQKVNTTMNDKGVFEFKNVPQEAEASAPEPALEIAEPAAEPATEPAAEPEPVPEPETKQETETARKQNFGPMKTRRKPTKKEVEEIVSSTKSGIVLGEGKENRSISDLGKSFKVVLKREGNLGKNINYDEKIGQLQKLVKSYEKGENGEDFETVKKSVDDFLAGFSDDGQLKKKLKDHAKELNEKQWVVYLRNLFNAIDEYSRRIKSPQSQQSTKKNKSVKTISKRNTRKLRR